MERSGSAWPEVALGDGLLVDVQPGFACGANSRSDEGAIAHLRPMNVTREGTLDLDDIKYVPVEQADSARRLIVKGDVLFNNTNTAELVGKTALYSDDAPRAFSNHMTRLRVNHDRVDPRYLALALHAKWRDGHFEQVCNNHVSQASVNRNALLATTIPLPPLDVQRTLVGTADSLNARLSAVHRRLERGRSLLRAYRSRAFDALAGEIPSETARIGDISTSVEYGYTAPAKRNGDGPRFLRITDIQNGKVDWEVVPTCAITPEKEAKFALAPGDILFARTGATTGKSFLVRECPRSVFASYLIRVRASAAVLPEYLYAYFQSGAYWDAISAQAAGNAQPGVNATKLRALEVPLPPVEGQAALVRRFTELTDPVDGIETRLRTALRAVDEARAGVFPRLVGAR